jgi:AcrR family transcriptional regulator
MTVTSRKPSRRVPHQRRARATVEAILEAAVRVLKRDGVAAITTNRVAEIAGVSIGSIYQYFPDKRAIFIALHRRHVEEIDRRVEHALIAQTTAPLEALLQSMVDAMVEAHSADPELHELLSTQVPHRGDGTQEFAQRMQGAFRLAIAVRAHERAHARCPRAWCRAAATAAAVAGRGEAGSGARDVGVPARATSCGRGCRAVLRIAPKRNCAGHASLLRSNTATSTSARNSKPSDS